MTLLLLAYDESLPEYQSKDFREVIIEFFLDLEIDCKLDSPVETTIYIKTQQIEH